MSLPWAENVGGPCTLKLNAPLGPTRTGCEMLPLGSNGARLRPVLEIVVQKPPLMEALNETILPWETVKVTEPLTGPVLDPL